MSVQEDYAIAVSGREEGLAIAGRLAASNGASLRWAALWPVEELGSDLLARFASRASPVPPVEGALPPLCVSSPTLDEVRHLLARAGDNPLCVHWSPAIYTTDEGPDAPWISFLDPWGITRDDARIYRIELALGAIPLTTADRPDASDFAWGPRPARGVQLRLTAIRDHLPRAQLLSWLAAAASVPVGSIAVAVD